jgi:hypothetical protein
VAGAKEAVAFCDEFRQADFRDVRIVRTSRNARARNPAVLAAEIVAIR